MHPGHRIRNQEGIYFVTFAVVEWVDVFTRKEYADIVVESLEYCQKEKGLIVYAWCLMSNYLHLIIAAKEGFQLSDILRDFKKFTSYQIIKAIEESKIESQKIGCCGYSDRRARRIRKTKNTSSGNSITTLKNWKPIISWNRSFSIFTTIQ